MTEDLPKPVAPFPHRGTLYAELRFHQRRSTAFVMGKHRREAKNRYVKQCELAELATF